MPSARWNGFRSVLCGVDFSEHSRLALQYAAAVALRGSGTITVLHANDPLLVAAAKAALGDRGIAARSARELKAFVDASLPANAKERLRVATRTAVGDAAAAILKAAARGRSDLIVLGTHGLTGAERLLVGSTALTVLQETRVPVLAIPGASRMSSAGKSSRVPPSWPGGRIAAAVELDGDGETEIAVAAELARWFGSSLVLLHAVTEIAAPAWLEGDLRPHERARLREAQQLLEALAADTLPSVDVFTSVASGRVPEALLALVAAERVSLVVTALHDRRGWFGARRGSVSYHLLSHAAPPVLAWPPRWRPR